MPSAMLVLGQEMTSWDSTARLITRAGTYEYFGSELDSCEYCEFSLSPLHDS
jgi:hypothetical protein